MASSTAKPKRFRLNFVNAAEDVPRLVRAYGRACQGEFALVLRPREQRGVLVLVTKKDGAFMWRSSEGGDAPAIPESPISAEDAVKLVKVEQKALPKASPISLRGQWAGTLTCAEGEPVVELRRKLATYGWLRIASVPGGRWTWRVERTEKWFSEPGDDEGTAETLLAAIEAGLRGAMGLLSEACSLRDSRRRAAFDSGWAEKHPIRPAKEGRNPTDRLKVRPPRGRRRKAPPPSPVDAPVPSLPDAPATATAMKRMAAEVTAEADALADLRGLAWVWAETGIRDEVAAWFDGQGFDAWAEQIRAYDGSPDQPVDAFVEALRADVRAEDLDQPAEKEALAWLDTLHAGWMEAPQLMERARKLIRYAARMSESELCRGREKREAIDAVQRAVQSYEEARDAIAAERPVDGIRTLRRIGERVALSAAKSAKACAAGQMSLTATLDEPEPPFGERGKTAVPGLQIVPLGVEPTTAAELRTLTQGHAQAFEADPKASTAKKWVKSALLHVGLEAVNLSAKSRRFDDLGGGRRVFVTVALPETVEEDATDAKLHLVAEATPRGLSIEDWSYGAAKQVRRSGRKNVPVEAPPATEGVDAEKDKALLDAFSAAIAAAMKDVA